MRTNRMCHCIKKEGMVSMNWLHELQNIMVITSVTCMHTIYKVKNW